MYTNLLAVTAMDLKPVLDLWRSGLCDASTSHFGEVSFINEIFQVQVAFLSRLACLDHHGSPVST